ncbi:MAG: molybdopterin-dependent oxidoreductase [Firmicutes bacterium]|nr:molybdopterin-dependent oxidoreductase [Bacillota bacterium]
MPATKKIELTVNGQSRTVEVPSGKNLLYVLREDLGLTGSKDGCNKGHCGCCGVIIDGKFELSCMISAEKAQGRKIETIEGLGTPDNLHPLQEAFVRTGAIQCGFCTPGMVMASKALLDKNQNPTQDEVTRAVNPVLCRCTGYRKIFEAVHLAARIMRGEEEKERELIPAGTAIGQRVPRIDGPAKVTGTALYAADRTAPGMNHIKVLRSPHYHAEIVSIDVSEAEASPGVVTVLTAADIKGKNVMPPDQHILSPKKVRFVGDPVAAVVGKTPEDCERALPKIKVEYRVLPAVFDPVEAMQDGAPQVHDSGNLVVHQKLVKGDFEQGFAEADVIVENEYWTPWGEHAYMEPEACLAVPDADGGVTLYTTTQHPHGYQVGIKEVLDLPAEKVRVIGDVVGGAFGGKSDHTHSAIAALAAVKTGAPAKIVYSREESLLVSTKRHAFHIKCRTGAYKDGRLAAHQLTIVSDTGAYISAGRGILSKATYFGCGPYNIPHAVVETFGVYTNNQIAGQMRGYGKQQVMYAVESQIDQLANKLGIDRMEIRMKNALREGMKSPVGQPIEESPGVVECMEAIRPAYEAALARRGQARPGWRRGVGIGTVYLGIFRTGGGTDPAAHACCTLLSDGRVEFATGYSDAGQAGTTVLAQIAADALGMPLSNLVVAAGTSAQPDAGRVSGSRQTYMSGNAVVDAARKFREALLASAADALGLPPGELEILDSRIRSRNNPEAAISFADLAKRGPVSADGSYAVQIPKPDPEIASRLSPGTTREVLNQGFHEILTGCAHMAEVEVNMRTGKVEVLKIAAAHNVGKVINPLSLEGQFDGGCLGGVGFAIKEEFIPYQTKTLGQFQIPRAKEAIPELDYLFVEVPSRKGPYGAQGSAEFTPVPTGAAVMNAIADACGVFVNRLPATPARLKEAIKQAR